MLAESFASIVGLLGLYRSEKGSEAQLDYNEFMEWLVKTNHQQVKELLEINVNATVYIKALLNQDHKIFKEKLDKIETALTVFASTIEGFDSLAQALNSKSYLSEQAIDILRQFQDSGASKLLEIKSMDGVMYCFIDGPANGYLEVKQARFIEDDLRTLIEYGLLLLDYNSQGGKLYIFTRAASELVSKS